MKIKFKYAWFGPNSIYYAPGVHDIPDDLYDKLPKTAMVVNEVVKVVEVQKPKTLKDFDEERMNSDSLVAVLNKKGK